MLTIVCINCTSNHPNFLKWIGMSVLSSLPLLMYAEKQKKKKQGNIISKGVIIWLSARA